jgi:hypothetical protein
MSLVVGNENYNWKELEESCKYKNGYSPEHPTIVNFWKVRNGRFFYLKFWPA